MKQFDLQKYLKNPNIKVCTRDGRPVRIICTDVLSHFPIVAAIKLEVGNEFIQDYDLKGRASLSKNEDCDLFFADEEKANKILDELKSYLKNTPKEQVEKDWKEIQDWYAQHFTHEKHNEEDELSEDEKIRKSLIRNFTNQHSSNFPTADGFTREQILSWLEKKGEKKPIEQDTEINDLWVYIREWNDEFGRLPKDEDELAACIDYVMKRQKSTDKVEPKFKVGDWCIDNEDGTIFQIVKVLDNTYTYKTNEGETYSCTHYSLEEDARLWTIEDAEDGDVLALNNEYFLFKEKKNSTTECYISHCFIDSAKTFRENGEFLPIEKGNKVCPTTKEQYDLLFSKIKEEGYVWDAEKKELKKIEQSHDWNEEDERNLEGIIDEIDANKNDAPDYDLATYNGFLSWLKSLKDRIQPQPKQEWSEEDEYQINTILHGLDLKKELYKKEGNQVEEKRYKTQYDWLKSFKDKIQSQPKQDWSEEDSKRLLRIHQFIWANRKGDTDEIYQQEQDADWLMTLKPQNRWKPSEYDISLLEEITRNIRNNVRPFCSEVSALEDLIKNIKTL